MERSDERASRQDRRNRSWRRPEPYRVPTWTQARLREMNDRAELHREIVESMDRAHAVGIASTSDVDEAISSWLAVQRDIATFVRWAFRYSAAEVRQLLDVLLVQLFALIVRTPPIVRESFESEHDESLSVERLTADLVAAPGAPSLADLATA